MLGTGSSVAYAASKAALDTMSFSLARALGPEIRVNIVAPGYVKTPWQVAAHGAGRRRGPRAHVRRSAPLKAAPRGRGRRRGDRLADRGRARVTGEIVYVDGGHAHRYRRVEHTTTSSSAPARRAACSPTAFPRIRRNESCCSRPGRATPNPWIHVPLGYGKLFARTDVNWAYESEPEPALNGRQHLHAARQGARRLLVDQRPGLHPRPARGLRRLGHPRLGFDALLPYFEKAEPQLKVSDLRAPRALRRLHRRRRPRSACRAPTTSTARRRKAPATTAPRRYRGRRAQRRRSPICGRRRSARISSMRSECACHQDPLRGKRGDGVECSTDRSCSQAQSDCSVRRSVQLAAASAALRRRTRERCSSATAFRWCTTRRGSASDLQDHFYARTFWRCRRPITLNDDMASLVAPGADGHGLPVPQQGPHDGRRAATRRRSCARGRSSTRPDAQLYFINFSSAQRGGVLHPHSGFTCAVSQMQVESRGSVHIRSAAPTEPPAIRYNYLATENDRRVMVDGLKFVRRICATPPMRDYVDRRVSARRQGAERRGLARLLPRVRRDRVPSDLDLPHRHAWWTTSCA